MLQNNLFTPKPVPSTTEGFSLLELIVVVFMIGILSAIAAPGWLHFVNIQRLNTAQYQVYQAMQAAKSNATRDKLTWQVSIREVNEQVQWALHRAESGYSIPNTANWHSLDSHIQVYKDQNDQGKHETTLHKDSPNGPWHVQFNYKGNTNGQLGQITLIPKDNSQIQRCVYVSTLIGTLRMGENNDKPNDSDKYCY
ncbi:MAG: type II secretion system protein [Coleofasciculus sp. A1-SPW-01]|uniref:pilus assembly FimT family protein n=1 Tax=Coleofasciculus sp. A1-SPW-01 TaxID=3070819 RepID=UPI0032F0D8C0